MIRICITAAAFDAIGATMPIASVAFERAADAKGDVWIWLDPFVVDKLSSLRGPGESFSDVILMLAKAELARRQAH